MQTQKRFFYELYLILAIALPMMIAQVAQVGTGFVDTIMAGAVGKSDLAAVGFGSSVFATIYITLLAFPTALNPLLSHEFGAKRIEKLRHTAQQGVWLCFFVGLVGALLVVLSGIFLPNFLNWEQSTIRTTHLYLYGVALGLPAAIVSRALQSYAAAVGRTQEVMWIGLGGLLLNIPLNYILIYGKLGLPKLGGAGCGFATAAEQGAALLLRRCFILMQWVCGSLCHIKNILKNSILIKRLGCLKWRRFVLLFN